MENQSAEKDKRISDLLAEKKAFMRVVSHDLRSPISRIIGFGDLLQKDLAGNEDLEEFAKMVVDAGWQLSNMIARIMEVEEFESEERELIKAPADLGQTLSSIVEDHRDAFDKKEITINLNISREDLTYETDKIDLDLVINNLLSNASKFSLKGSSVDISIEKEDESILLKIKDQGPGFKEGEKEIAFDKFSKLSAKPTGGETASGLGLYVVKVCIDRMGASEIDILDNQPSGTSVEVRFK